nr:unnamed protein product [Callosobruchus chinensis]
MPFIMLSGKVGKNKKKPPPRPPPPNFSRYKSKSSLILNQQTENLIDLDSPDSPKVERNHNIGGSVSSSFSNQKHFLYHSGKSGYKQNIPSSVGPTIIKPKVLNTVKTTAANKLPMPDIPPPSPPKDIDDVNIAYGIALYNYQGTEPSDLSFQVNDVIVLIRKINEEWYYGKVLDKEGMFPANFIDVQVPLVETMIL